MPPASSGKKGAAIAAAPAEADDASDDFEMIEAPPQPKTPTVRATKAGSKAAASGPSTTKSSR